MRAWVNLVRYFLIKDIKTRYAGSGFGILWTIMMPILQIVLYGFVFSTVMRVRPYADGRIPYIYFLLSTFFFWLAIPEGVLRSGSVIVENAELVKKVPFPNIILPVAVTLSVYLQNLVGVLIFLVIFTVTGMSHAGLLLIIPVLLLQLIFSIGVGMFMAAIVTYMRDLQQIIGFVLQGMFFLSPVLYSIDSIPEKFKNLVYLNPVTVYIESYHKIIFERTFPGLAQTGCMIVISLSALILGTVAFNKLKEGFADIL